MAASGETGDSVSAQFSHRAAAPNHHEGPRAGHTAQGGACSWLSHFILSPPFLTFWPPSSEVKPPPPTSGVQSGPGALSLS